MGTASSYWSGRSGGSLVRRGGALLFLLLLFVAIRSIFIDADPPLYLPGKYPLRELVVEPIAKAGEARNWALFGRFAPHPADEYQFWRAQSPLWVYPLAGFLRVFGAGIVQLRVFAIAYTALGYLAFLALARKGLRGGEFWAAALFPAIDAVYALYSRSGLLEPAVNSWMCVAVLCLLLARKHWAYLIGVQWAFVFGFFTKAAAVYAFPLLVMGSIWLLVRPRGSSEPRRARAAVLIHGCVLGALVAVYVLGDAYMRTLIWNFNHVLLEEDNGASFLTDSLSLEEVGDSVADWSQLKNFSLVVPITGVLGLLEAGAVASALARRRPVAAWRVLVVGWMLSAVAALLVVKTDAIRFDTLLVPPAALAAASAVRTLRLSFSWGRLAVLSPILLSFVAFNGWMLWQVHSARSYESSRVTKALLEAIGDRRAAIVGYWSAPVVFGTPYEHYYVKNHFNTSPAILQKLAITELLVASKKRSRYKDYSMRVIEQHFPKARGGLAPRFVLPLRSVQVSLYSLPEPLARPRKGKRGSER